MTGIIKKFVSSFLIETELKGPFMADMAGTIVVIAGGTGKIGKAITRVFVKKGARVIALSRSAENAKKGSVETMKVDITNKQEVNAVVARIVRKYHRIDVLINCAGHFSEKEVEAVSAVEYDRVMDTNVKGMFLMTGAVVPYMKKRKNGLVINIGSKISRNTNVSPRKVLYATSKYAVEGFSLALSNELKRFGIRVTCLMLGTVNTFVSFKSKKYLAPENIAFVIAMIINCPDVDFEQMVIKSKKQLI